MTSRYERGRPTERKRSVFRDAAKANDLLDRLAMMEEVRPLTSTVQTSDGESTVVMHPPMEPEHHWLRGWRLFVSDMGMAAELEEWGGDIWRMRVDVTATPGPDYWRNAENGQAAMIGMIDNRQQLDRTLVIEWTGTVPQSYRSCPSEDWLGHFAESLQGKGVVTGYPRSMLMGSVQLVYAANPVLRRGSRWGECGDDLILDAAFVSKTNTAKAVVAVNPTANHLPSDFSPMTWAFTAGPWTVPVRAFQTPVVMVRLSKHVTTTAFQIWVKVRVGPPTDGQVIDAGP